METIEAKNVIVGAGAMGSAAAYHLAKRGEPVVLLEQFALGHDRGSSHGAARITRHSYADAALRPSDASGLPRLEGARGRRGRGPLYPHGRRLVLPARRGLRGPGRGEPPGARRALTGGPPGGNGINDIRRSVCPTITMSSSSPTRGWWPRRAPSPSRSSWPGCTAAIGPGSSSRPRCGGSTSMAAIRSW